MNIIKLTGVLSLSGEPIFVNFDNVSFYHYDSSPSGATKYTQIYFGSDDHWVRVKETPEEIMKIICPPTESYVKLGSLDGVPEERDWHDGCPGCDGCKNNCETCTAKCYTGCTTDCKKKGK